MTSNCSNIFHFTIVYIGEFFVRVFLLPSAYKLIVIYKQGS